MWRPRHEDYPDHRETVNCYLHGKEACWSEPPSLWPKFVTVRDRLLHDVPPPAYVLDVGCFTGYFLRQLADCGYRGYGVDLQRDLMRALHETAKHGGVLDFAPGAMEQVGDLFPPETFDAVTALDVLEHALDDQRGVDALARVLRTGGWAYVHVPRDDDAREHVRSYAEPGRLWMLFSDWATDLLEGVDEHGRPTWLVVAQKR